MKIHWQLFEKTYLITVKAVTSKSEVVEQSVITRVPGGAGAKYFSTFINSIINKSLQEAKRNNLLKGELIPSNSVITNFSYLYTSFKPEFTIIR